MVGRCYADRMRRAETIITLTTGERGELETTVRSRTAPYRAVQRARLVLLAADGTPNTAIAREVGLTRARVVVWRKRFAAERSAGLNDGARPGKARKYTASTERGASWRSWMNRLPRDTARGQGGWSLRHWETFQPTMSGRC